MTVLIVCIVAIIFEHTVPCMKDFEYVKNGQCVEINARVIEFTERTKTDGVYDYTHPKFYIPQTDEYIVLNCREVEVGKTYKIRYLPNTKICEVVFCYG